MPSTNCPCFGRGANPPTFLKSLSLSKSGFLYQKMTVEIDSDYPYRYDLIRNYASELTHITQQLTWPIKGGSADRRPSSLPLVGRELWELRSTVDLFLRPSYWCARNSFGTATHFAEYPAMTLCSPTIRFFRPLRGEASTSAKSRGASRSRTNKSEPRHRSRAQEPAFRAGSAAPLATWADHRS